MKKKVLILIPDRLIKPTGGMGESLKPLLDILHDEFDFYIVGFPATSDQIPKYLKGYVAPSPIFTGVKYPPLSALYSQIEYFSSAIQLPKPDMVFVYDWSLYLAGVKTAKHFEVPLIVNMCLSPIMLARDGFNLGINMSELAGESIHHALCEMEKMGLFEADRIIHVSHGYAKRFEEVSAFKSKERFVPISIDLAKWQNSNLPKYILPGTNPKKLIYIGRFTELKGVLSLCAAKIPSDIDLIFIGEKESAEKRCMEAILDKCKDNSNAHYIGPLFGKDKIAALKSADAVIFPSFHESAGVVALEGLASKCIMLSSRVGGIADCLDDTNSIYCGFTTETIQHAFEQFLNLSKERVDEMHSKGIITCQSYSVENAANLFRNVLREV
jgi:glycosyltransferase involved in cell wall biosynthesis